MYRSASPFDRFWCAHDDVLRVREEERGLDLERELDCIFSRLDCALGLGVTNRTLDAPQPVAEEGDEMVSNRAGLPRRWKSSSIARSGAWSASICLPACAKGPLDV